MSHTSAPTGRLFNNPVLSDVTIKLINNGEVVREYRAHKAILSAHSGFFLKAFTSNFVEATSDVIEVHDDDPEIFDFVLKFLYLPVYDSSDLKREIEFEIIDQIAIPIRIAEVADKYDIRLIEGPTAEDLAKITENAYEFSSDKVKAREATKAAIDQYYTFCTKPGSPIGKTLGKAGLRVLRRSELERQILSTPIFGADVALCANSAGKWEQGWAQKQQ